MSIVITKSDAQIRQEFFALRSSADVAKLLEVSLRTLNFFLIKNWNKNYTTFDIAKKSGKPRTISAPVSGLKLMQKKLNQVLLTVYQAKAAVHGFALGRSIFSNASEHIAKRYVLNVDLLDFFPSINFGRVRGMFMAQPYKLGPPVATVLAQICCHENKLPQGAPTSPVVSNMLCAKMDSALTRLARKYNSRYTRYADDISFSVAKKNFPRGLAFHGTEETGAQLQPGTELTEIVTENGFAINPLKLRLQYQDQRQRVTGLTVNVRPNVNRKLIRQVRAMLHSWEVDGLEGAETIFRSKWDQKHRLHPNPVFQRVVKGKIDFIGFVRGRDSADYAHLYWKFSSLDRKFRPKPIVAGPRASRVVLKQAVWVLESEEGDGLQGTGFFLHGYGLVTCHHVIEKGTMAYHPDRPNETYPIQVIATDQRLDLAILKIPVQPSVELSESESPDDFGDGRITLMGFPHHMVGQTVNIAEGVITEPETFGIFGIL